LPNRIKVQGIVTIRQGRKILCREVVNHFVDAGLKGLLSAIIWQYIRDTYGYEATHSFWRLPANSWNIYVGNDTTIATTASTSALVDPIGAPPGTAPDVKGLSVHSGASDGDWYVILTGTWNVGSLPAETLGEVALYMRAPDKTTFAWTVDSNTDYAPSSVMISRLSTADGDFGSFTIDTSKPLTVDWKVRFQFA